MLETIVFGRRAGSRAAAYAAELVPRAVSDVPLQAEQHRLARLMANGPGVRSWQVRDDLGKVMSVNLGLFRTKESMTEALAQIHVLKARAEQVFVQDRGKIFNSDLIQSLELGSLVEVADTIAASALAREESRGAHYRSDFPNRDDVRWLTHTLAHRAPDSPRLSYTPVTVTRFPPK